MSKEEKESNDLQELVADNLQNDDGTYPVIDFDDFDRNDEPVNVGSGVEVISDDSLENYSQNDEDEDVETFELTFAELKKYLRMKKKKEGDASPTTDEEIEALTKEQIDELKEIMRIRDRKALINFVNRRKIATDEDAKNLTDEEFLELTNKALIMSKFLTYNPKKNFGVKYKKERQRKNKQAKASRRANRR